MLKGKHIIVGITGSIAAYKAASLVRLLVKEGAEVKVVMTELAKQFITPLTLATLSKHPVMVEFYNPENGDWHSHVDMGLWADLYLIAPATANTLGKMAHGIADNLLLTTYLSAKCPVMVAPAMDLDMYRHPATRQNLHILQSYGVRVIEPAYEKIDPVRFIGNYSSGKMGFALAEEFAARGAEVVLVAGPVSRQTEHPAIRRINVESAAEMFEQVMNYAEDSHIIVSCAAVADFTPDRKADLKLKRGEEELVLKLKPTCDIAAELGRRKQKGQVLVGFALETDDETGNALRKLHKKNLDLIVLNSLKDSNACFGYDTNKVTIIDRNEVQWQYELKSKKEVAHDIVDRIVQLG